MSRCVRCGEYSDTFVAEGIQECESCGEEALMNEQDIADLLNAVYLQSGHNNFKDFVEEVNNS